MSARREFFPRQIGDHQFVQLQEQKRIAEAIDQSLECFLSSPLRKLLYYSENPMDEMTPGKWTRCSNDCFELLEWNRKGDRSELLNWLRPGNWTICCTTVPYMSPPVIDLGMQPNEKEIHPFALLVQAYFDLEYVTFIIRNDMLIGAENLRKTIFSQTNQHKC